MVHLNENYFIMKRLFLMKSNNLKSGIDVRQFLEAAPRDILCKRVFLEILTKFTRNTSVRVSFLIKLQASGYLEHRKIQ